MSCVWSSLAACWIIMCSTLQTEIFIGYPSIYMRHSQWFLRALQFPVCSSHSWTGGAISCPRSRFSEEFSMEFLVELISTLFFLILAYLFRNCMPTRAPKTLVSVGTNADPEVSQVMEPSTTSPGSP
uniref:Secreted protein n=1 Tax=Strongyloides venezuelensis TaxID=75913 RepID=A0A0K0FPL8_STRVS